eukprot:s35_g40.t1
MYGAPIGSDGRSPVAPPTSFSPGIHGKGLDGKVNSAPSTWPSIDQLIAAVPVRPYAFEAPKSFAGAAGGNGVQYGILEYAGSIPKPHASGEAKFSLLKGVLTDNEAAQLLSMCSQVLSEEIGSGRARDLDSVDGRPRFAVDIAEFGVLSSKCAPDVRPLVETALLPLVRQKYDCPTASLSSAYFRRFVPEERRFVPPHYEHGSFAVLVIALQEPTSYTGGFFVQGSGKAFMDRRFIQLSRGDICLFQYDLCHGVDVQEGSQLELVLHFKDSPQAAADGTCPWYWSLAKQNHPVGLYGHALSLAAQNRFSAAKDFLDKACEQDHVEALCTAAEWCWEPPAESRLQESSASAVALWRRAAELGHCRSRSRYGGLLLQGVPGRLAQDLWEGKRLLRLAFEQDDPDAAPGAFALLFHLGHVLLQDGDRDGATKLLAACTKGHPRACFQVAEMYREGLQFPKDVQQSIRYTKWAAHQGDAQALSNLGHMLINGMGVVKDEAKAVRLFRHAAKLGAAEGMLNYGLALLRGSGGVKVDYQEALEWAQKSAAWSRSPEELRSLGVRELRDLLRLEGIDFSDCVEKSDLIARAALHLPGVAEPWDAAPEHTVLLEPKKLSREDIMRQRAQAAASKPSGYGTAPVDAVDTGAKEPAVTWNEASGGPASQEKNQIPAAKQDMKLVKTSIEHRVSSTDANRELELRILAEQELRFSEVTSLSQRCSTLQRERDQLQASFSNDVARLSVQLEEDKRKMEECEVLRSEAEAKQQASDALTKDQAQELKQCKAAIDEMMCKRKEHTDMVSSQEQGTEQLDAFGADLLRRKELQRCRDVIHQLKSEGSEQSSVMQSQQQATRCACCPAKCRMMSCDNRD